MPLLVLLFAATSIALFSSVIDVHSSYVDESTYTEDKSRLLTVANAINRHLMYEGSLPTSLSQLTTVSGYEYIESYITDDMGYAIEAFTEINRNITYQRSIVFLKNNKEETDNSFLSNNDCGIASFATSEEWCKRDGSLYVLIDDINFQTSFAAQSIIRLDRLGQQLFNAFYINNSFPKTHSNGTLSVDEVITIADIVDYIGSAKDCVSIFDFQNAVITCELIFGLDGSSVNYLFKNDKFVIIYVTLPFKKANGDPQIVARPLRII